VKDHTETSTELKGLVAGGKLEASLPSTLDKAHKDKLDKLAKLSGKHFTKEYNELQLAAHTDAVSLFERYGKSGENADLKGFASKHLPHLQQHLLMAQDLCTCCPGTPVLKPLSRTAGTPSRLQT